MRSLNFPPPNNHGSFLRRRRYATQFLPTPVHSVCSSTSPPFTLTELVNIHNAFHQHRHATVLSTDTSSLSPTPHLPPRGLQRRTPIALRQHAAVISELNSEAASSPDLSAVLAFAQCDLDPSNEAHLPTVQSLAQSHADNLTVQLLAGTILFRAGQREEALALLSRHQGSLDAVALITHIHLASNRADLAAQEVKRARGWAQDSLLVNIAEAWVGLREGGTAKYQSSFYVFEEMATAPGEGSAEAQVAQGVAEMHLGRWEEAEAAVGEALGRAAKGEGKADGDVFANAVVLQTVLGKGEEVAEARGALEKRDADHVMLVDLRKKRELFEAAKGKYNPVFEAEA